ncbi:MAG: TatD family hydrolase [Thermoleophilaceae bacterium]|nr:TatD family hydrolase [Thermoleophilaceae bacterium]
MIDSHAHVEMCEGTPAEVVGRALAAGVTRILTIALNSAGFAETLAIAEQHDAVFAAVGWHPNETTGFGDTQLAEIETAAAHPRVRAIGETGLDFFRESAPPADQRRAFLAQIALAAKLQLPLSIHARAAEAEVMDLLEEHANDVPGVVLHCFSQPDLIDRAIGAGFFCSFAGNVTFKNAPELREAAARVPDDLLLVETDAPFLAPQPVRGQRNEPAYVKMTAELLAEVRGTTYAALEAQVESNAAKLFQW